MTKELRSTLNEFLQMGLRLIFLMLCVALTFFSLKAIVLGASPVVYKDFKKTYEPYAKQTQIIIELTSGIPSSFKFFIPPHSKDVKAWVYVEEGIVQGAIVVAGKEPSCDYSNVAKEPSAAFALCYPWQQTGDKLSTMKGVEKQVIRTGGQIVALTGGVGTGQWVYVRGVAAKGYSVSFRQFKVSIVVEQPAFENWLKTISSNPSGESYASGACSFERKPDCNPDEGDDDGGGSGGGTIERPDYNILTCMIKRCEWDEEKNICICKEQPPEPTTKYPLTNSLPSYEVTLKEPFEPITTFPKDYPKNVEAYAALYKPAIVEDGKVVKGATIALALPRWDSDEVVFAILDKLTTLHSYSSIEASGDYKLLVFKELSVESLKGCFLYFVVGSKDVKPIGALWHVE